MLNVIVFYI